MSSFHGEKGWALCHLAYKDRGMLFQASNTGKDHSSEGENCAWLTRISDLGSPCILKLGTGLCSDSICRRATISWSHIYIIINFKDFQRQAKHSNWRAVNQNSRTCLSVVGNLYIIIACLLSVCWLCRWTKFIGHSTIPDKIRTSNSVARWVKLI